MLVPHRMSSRVWLLPAALLPVALLAIAAGLLAPGEALAQRKKPAPALDGSLFGLPRNAAKDSAEATWDVRLKPGKGSDVTLSITAKIPEGWHLYSMTQKADGALPTTVKLGPSVGLQPVDATYTADREPKVVPGPTDDTADQEQYEGQVTWTRKYKLKDGARPEDVRLSGTIDFMICSEPGEGLGQTVGECRQGKHEFAVRLAAAGEDPAPASEQAAPPPGGTPDDLAPPPQAVPPQAAPPDAQDAPPGVAETPAATDNVYVQPQSRSNPTPLVSWKASIVPGQARPGDVVTLKIEADVQKGWHVYSPNQEQKDGEGPVSMQIQFNTGILEPKSAFEGPKPHEQKPELEEWAALGIIDRFHEGQVTWTRQFQVPENAKPGDQEISGALSYQVCSSSNCITHAVKFLGSIAIGTSQDSKPAVLIGSELPFSKAGELITDPQPVQEGGLAVTREAKATVNEDPRQQGLLMFLLTAVVAGFVALLTPCVFPMVPITVSVFHKQAEKQHTNPVLMAAVYALSIIGTFTILGLLLSATFGAASLNTLANNPVLNLVIAVVLIIFAFNMLGMYEIVMPSWVLNFTAGQQSRGGYVGVIFMGLTFTLTSFTCTFAFAGALLTMAAAGDWLWPVMGMLAFSSAFALPFFLLALFPGFLQKLPKSGGWMNTIKVVMGFLELGMVFKFLSVADVMWNGRPFLFDFELVITAWIVLALLTGIYLLGFFRTPHDMPIEHVSVPRLILAMIFLGLGTYMSVGLFANEKANGVIWENVVAFAPPKIEGMETDTDLGPTMTEGGLKYGLDVDKALAYAVQQKKPLFIDFTGVTCINCRRMEKGPLASPVVVERLKELVLVRAYTDKVPNVADFAEGERLRKRNIELQGQWFGDVTLPAYLVVTPVPGAFDKPESIANRFIGFQPDVQLFTRFLDEGKQQAKTNAVAQGRAAPGEVPATMAAAGR